MKQIFIILFAISMVYANHIKWHGNYEKALKEAREQNKVLMVLLIKNNCQKCKDLVKDIFVNKPYIDELNQNVISVIVNIDNKHSFPIEMYWSNKYPTLFFVDSKNEIFIHKPFDNITQKDIQNILIKIMHNKS
jgi:thioredoxin-related protein